MTIEEALLGLRFEGHYLPLDTGVRYPYNLKMGIDLAQKRDILKIARKVVRDARYSPKDSWNGEDEFQFDDSCGCYSDWTTEGCKLVLFLSGTLKGDGYEQARKIESEVDKYAQNHLEWSGCSCCGDSLYVTVYLFPKKLATD